ncbi:DUF6116 family protein [Magnetospira sp. QH-2]|uniref:DUF6116 family protein n=1 Tax=Magnetospira sp. (strain QH-2) TaxID=1288970 RepID=UPI0003E80CB7|nr:DUF6116 family protein [Magnetospira sp. QH-2]CCQ72506.1 protein of unknown function [Magnetospira sp. QH-2]
MDFFWKWASGLKFRSLFFLTAGLFLFDLMIPDLVPFIDELLLGLLTLIFGAWRKKTRPEIEGPPS